MALKSKTENQIQFDDLEFEAEVEQDRIYTTISGKEQEDTFDQEKISIRELDIGDRFEGKPEITHFKNDDKKYDSLRLRLLDDGEYLDSYINIPKPDDKGFITNIRAGFDFYRTCFDFIYSILLYRDEQNVVDTNGEPVNKFGKVNIINFAKYVDQFNRVGLEVTEGNTQSDYNSFILYKME